VVRAWTVPCLRRVSHLAYGAVGDEDADAETLMSFALEGAATVDDGEDWVATHTSKRTIPISLPTIGDIPDLDSDSPSHSLATASLSSPSKADQKEVMPDLDDIPDMDDDDDEDGMGGAALVEEEDDAALKSVAKP
jgi:ubiquitin-like-conjugating enzyme ATG3